MDVATVFAVSVALLGALLGVLLTFLTLPGIWLMLAASLIAELLSPGLLGWWTVGFVFAVAVAAEIAEFLASAVGSGYAGGSKAGAIGSIVGSIIGLIAGTPVFPIVGSIIGAIIGAGVGAFVFERVLAKRAWIDSARSGRGALYGRAMSIVVKGGCSVIAGVGVMVGLVLG